jgi:hypothetical protein
MKVKGAYFFRPTTTTTVNFWFFFVLFCGFFTSNNSAGSLFEYYWQYNKERGKMRNSFEWVVKGITKKKKRKTHVRSEIVQRSRTKPNEAGRVSALLLLVT